MGEYNTDFKSAVKSQICCQKTLLLEHCFAIFALCNGLYLHELMRVFSHSSQYSAAHCHLQILDATHCLDVRSKKHLQLCLRT
jgi:hypothetical protein